MIKWFGKQFILGQIFYWAKERLSGLLLTIILLILVFYIHSEYLNYIEFKSANDANYIGTSFIVKNFLILAIVFGYIYFFRKINQTKKSIQDTKETIIRENKDNDKEKVKSLDEFLEDEEIDR
jgi:type III secretory pathway component EscU